MRVPRTTDRVTNMASGDSDGGIIAGGLVVVNSVANERAHKIWEHFDNVCT